MESKPMESTQSISEILVWLNKERKTNKYILNPQYKWIIENLFISTADLKQRGINSISGNMYFESIKDNSNFSTATGTPFNTEPSNVDYVRMADAWMSWVNVWSFADKLGFSDKKVVGGVSDAIQNPIISTASRASFKKDVIDKYPTTWVSALKQKADSLSVPVILDSKYLSDSINKYPITTGVFDNNKGLYNLKTELSSIIQTMFLGLWNDDEKTRIDKLQQQDLITKQKADELKANQAKEVNIAAEQIADSNIFILPQATNISSTEYKSVNKLTTKKKLIYVGSALLLLAASFIIYKKMTKK